MKPCALIVDDNQVNLKLACEVLAFEGYEVVGASSADEAIEAVHHSPPDVILMDIELPGMDGLALTRILKSHPATRHIPVIAVTAFAMLGDEDKARAVGCDAYITKPIDTRALGGIVTRIREEYRGSYEDSRGR